MISTTMLVLTFFSREIYKTPLSVDEVLSQLNAILINTNKKNMFNATTDDDLYKGYISGYRFSIERGSFLNRRMMNVIVDGVYNSSTKTVTYRPDTSTILSFSMLFVILSLISLLVILENSVYMLIWMPVLYYLAMMLMFNYELAIISDFIERICKAQKLPINP